MTASLECHALTAGYERTPVLRGLDLAVEDGEVVALMGPNGAGKTTALLAMTGFIPATGSVRLGGLDLARKEPFQRTRAGLVLVPEQRGLFVDLSVEANLRLALRRGGGTIDEVLDEFPPLRERLKIHAGALSGGEQQMLAIGRALIQRPRGLLIDEMTMGLSPLVSQQVAAAVRRAADDLGIGVVVVEQRLDLALSIADRVVVLVRGSVRLNAPATEVKCDLGQIQRAYFGSTLSPRTV